LKFLKTKKFTSPQCRSLRFFALTMLFDIDYFQILWYNYGAKPKVYTF
jgi:hypothetical protein